MYGCMYVQYNTTAEEVGTITSGNYWGFFSAIIMNILNMGLPGTKKLMLMLGKKLRFEFFLNLPQKNVKSPFHFHTHQQKYHNSIKPIFILLVRTKWKFSTVQYTSTRGYRTFLSSGWMHAVMRLYGTYRHSLGVRDFLFYWCGVKILDENHATEICKKR